MSVSLGSSVSSSSCGMKLLFFSAALREEAMNPWLLLALLGLWWVRGSDSSVMMWPRQVLSGCLTADGAGRAVALEGRIGAYLMFPTNLSFKICCGGFKGLVLNTSGWELMWLLSCWDEKDASYLQTVHKLHSVKVGLQLRKQRSSKNAS